ncbi:MAG: hypothetical protein EAX81_03650 [Candidatus Thorarchaeota archaeon]|nr:hypothetical protein [Candidatus Thorarchaeota archaeon]
MEVVNDGFSIFIYSMVFNCQNASYDLVEMRVHDILLEVDLSRHDPNNPGQEQLYDGTSKGVSESQQAKEFVSNYE